MPATEQTWRNLKGLHVVFAITAIVLLVATIVMLAADHNRPWKKYQRGFRDLETWSAAARVDEEASSAFREKTQELEGVLADARRADLDPAVVESFLSAVREANEDAQAADLVQLDVDQLQSQEDPGERLVLRGDVLQRCRDIVARAKFREDNRAGALKLRKAELDKNRADYELAIAEEAPEEKRKELLDLADAKRSEVEQATLAFQEANTHRKDLESIIRRMTADEDAASKAVANHRQQVTQLVDTLSGKAPNIGKSLLELPVLDAFNGPLRIDQIWLPNLTLNNNFRDVARFDRCTTCHQGMTKSAPGSPTDPAYPQEQQVVVSLDTPEEGPQPPVVSGDANNQLQSLYGFQLAPRGLFDQDAATISFVLPSSPAAVAGLRSGDVIKEIAGGRVASRSIAATSLVEMPTWGQPLSLVVSRGVPQPYATHPRLDLFVSDSSPHSMKTFGCTICHEGQGSATSFKWSSHSPNSPKQARQWHDEHGWFNNHHWIFPMRPQRFEESSCLKCHHQVVDLEPSERFPEPPAPKVVKGYHLIRQYGCYGCHEINGWSSPDERVGPDMRLTPNYHEVAAAIGTDAGLSEMGPSVTRWVSDVRRSPDGREARERLRDVIERDAAAGNEAKLSDRTHELAVLLKDPETPGGFPRVGPSLRHVASKVDFTWLYSWLRNPQDFRPSTRMPRFFGLWEHLEGKGLEESIRYEPLEIRSMSEYLLSSSQPFDYVQPYEGITAAVDVERGKKVFQVRGCLACHQHADFPDAKSNHGPDLSRIGAKVATSEGKAWLYSWLREPARYHPKTIMPNVLLEPVALPDGTLSDPAADATAYLMQSTQDWRPADVPGIELTEGERTALNELALMYLKQRFTAARAESVLASGLPSEASAIKGDEQMLAGLSGAERDTVLLRYVGKKTINKLACYGCHDIPGFEDAKPAGAALADWGRKDPSRIAFEQVSHFVMHQLSDHADHADHGHHGHSDLGHDVHSGDGHVRDELGATDLAYGVVEDDQLHVDPETLDADTGYFLQKLLDHEREGFLWQKLRQPRSYDYKKAENKAYNERYRMPQFPFDDTEREAVMTSVLGLVAEPPAPQFVHSPTPREQARLDGLVVAEQYNCSGCHALEMDRWDIRYKPESLGEAFAAADYPFLSPHFSPQQVEESMKTDRQGLRRATIVGMPMLDAETGGPQFVDEDGVPVDEDDDEVLLHRPVMPWRDVLIDGQPRLVGGQNLFVPEDAIRAGRHFPARGGDLARLLFPVVIADEREVNPNVKPDDAWGWLPPPLVGEGKKVQSNWLHGFLLNPQTIRPAAVLRMPRFNLASTEASKLVDYFAAVDGADFPYIYDPRLDESALAEKEKSNAEHLSGAMRIVTNNNYCVKCHLVGSYTPPGSVKALAPQLERIHERLRPGYVHDWIANPKRFLPYTGMPVNIPFDKPVSQDLYKGNSEQQVDALTDLLMHFDAFAKRTLPLDSYLGPLASPQPPDAPESGADVPAQTSRIDEVPPSAAIRGQNSPEDGVALN